MEPVYLFRFSTEESAKERDLLTKGGIVEAVCRVKQMGETVAKIELIKTLHMPSCDDGDYFSLSRALEGKSST